MSLKHILSHKVNEYNKYVVDDKTERIMVEVGDFRSGATEQCSFNELILRAGSGPNVEKYLKSFNGEHFKKVTEFVYSKLSNQYDNYFTVIAKDKLEFYPHEMSLDELSRIVTEHVMNGDFPIDVKSYKKSSGVYEKVPITFVVKVG